MKLLDYPSLLKSFVVELGKELAMRRTVWRVIPGTSHQFGSTENKVDMIPCDSWKKYSRK